MQKLTIQSIKKKLDIDHIEAFEERFIIIDENNKTVDDAQGYGYKSIEKAEKAMWYKFNGGKQKMQSEADKRKSFFKKYNGLEQFIYSVFENNYKEMARGEVTDEDILKDIKDKFGVDMPKKYLYN